MTTLPTINVVENPTLYAMRDGVSISVQYANGGVQTSLYRGEEFVGDVDYTYEGYESLREQNPEAGLQAMPPRKPGTNENGNTLGRVVGDSGGSSCTASQSNPEVQAETGAEGGTGGKILDGLQLGLDVLGLIPVFGEAADLVNAGVSAARGDYVGAALSLASAVPLAGYAATGVKGARKLADAVDTTADVTRQTARNVPTKQPAKKPPAKGGNGKRPPGGKGKKKKKLKCGEHGRYGELKKKTGDNKFDRDHIPSKAALKARAAELKGEPLSKAEERAIENFGNSIAIPKQAHIDFSPTYGQTLAEAAQDAKDLAGSARRDVDAMLKNLDKYDADGKCKKAYQKAVKRVLKDNDWFDTQLDKLID